MPIIVTYEPEQESDIYHYGVLGMKWGVRRYQNKDGSLTDAGIKRYYKKPTSDGYTELSRKGAKYNKKQREAFTRYKNSVTANVKAVNPDFMSKVQEYQKLKDFDRSAYDEYVQMWIDGKAPFKKNMSRERFEDTAFDLYSKTPEGQRQLQLRNELRSTVENAAKEHPLYSKSFKKLPSFTNTKYRDIREEDVNFGKEAVHQIMTEIEYFPYRVR